MNNNIVDSNGELRFYNNLTILNKLEAKQVYVLDYDKGGCFLRRYSPLELPSKVYDFEKEFI
jgi:hypothetical protein